MKDEQRTTATAEAGEVIRDNDRCICLYIEWLTIGIEDTNELIERIQKNGLADLSIYDFRHSLENLLRDCFESWIEDVGGMILATQKRKDEYNDLFRRYAFTVGKLERGIIEHFPNCQQAQHLAVAISRLFDEVRGAIDRGMSQYLQGNGKPSAADLLSDARHGALVDNVESAFISLLATQTGGTSKGDVQKLIRAELRKSKDKIEAAELRKLQRERAAGWLIAEREAGRKASPRDAAYHFCKEVTEEKDRGGYKTTNALTTALHKHKVELRIEQFITPRKK